MEGEEGDFVGSNSFLTVARGLADAATLEGVDSAANRTTITAVQRNQGLIEISEVDGAEIGLNEAEGVAVAQSPNPDTPTPEDLDHMGLGMNAFTLRTHLGWPPPEIVENNLNNSPDKGVVAGLTGVPGVNIDINNTPDAGLVAGLTGGLGGAPGAGPGAAASGGSGGDGLDAP
jgi:hypothetical protein